MKLVQPIATATRSRAARLQASTAKAVRCESCGAAVVPGKRVCDYCGSHHNLPVYRGETAPSAAPATRWLSPLRLVVLLSVAAVASLATAWLTLSR